MMSDVRTKQNHMLGPLFFIYIDHTRKLRSQATLQTTALQKYSARLNMKIRIRVSDAAHPKKAV